MALFRSRNEDTLEALLPRLDAARADLAAREGELQGRAIEAAMAEDVAAAIAPHVEAVRAARQVVETLEAAETELRRREAKRLAEAAGAAEKARINDIRRSTAQAIKAAVVLRRGVEDMVAAYRDLMKIFGKIERQATARELRECFGFRAAEPWLQQLVALEIGRLGTVSPGSGEAAFPGASTGAYASLVPYAKSVREVAPIDEQIAARLAGLCGDVRPTTRLSVPPLPPEPLPIAPAQGGGGRRPEGSKFNDGAPGPEVFADDRAAESPGELVEAGQDMILAKPEPLPEKAPPSTAVRGLSSLRMRA